VSDLDEVLGENKKHNLHFIMIGEGHLPPIIFPIYSGGSPILRYPSQNSHFL